MLARAASSSKRLLSAAALLLLVFAGTRALVRALPGDPVETLIAESGTPLPAADLRAELGLDRPFFPALAHDAMQALRGDWGLSLHGRQPVAKLVRARFGQTLRLAALALALGLGASLVIGLPAAARPGGRADRFCDAYGAVTAALPVPWIGPALLALFAVRIPLLPADGHPLLPALTLAIGFSGLWARLVRGRVAETLALPHVAAARARGLPEHRVLLKHGLAPAAGALLAYLGTQAGALLAGAFVAETLFGWRGMGALLLEAVLKRDYPVIEAATFAAAAASLAGTWAGDALQSLADPRARAAEAREA